jgi:hypothetical protein
MNTIHPARRGAAALAMLATTVGGAAASVETSTAAPAQAAPATTRLTFEVPGCEDCRVQLHQARETDHGDVAEWHSKARKVRDGSVVFTVRSKRTFGMSVTVDAPWEGHTGYDTTVAMRYRGKDVGDRVSFRQARDKRRASACWEGTRRDEVTLPLTVREVMVQGVHERVPGSIAFVRRTQSWLSPMRLAPKGVLGSQDVDVCR